MESDLQRLAAEYVVAQKKGMGGWGVLNYQDVPSGRKGTSCFHCFLLFETKMAYILEHHALLYFKKNTEVVEAEG